MYLVLCFSTQYTQDLTVSLTIHNCTTEDMGEYTIQLINEYGVAEMTTTVTIDFEVPMFVEPVKDVPANIGQSATFDCKVSGRPVPETKWLICGMELGESEKYHMEHINQTAKLQVNDVTVDDCEMTYTCRASNPGGQVESSGNIRPQGAWDEMRGSMLRAAHGVAISGALCLASHKTLPTPVTAALFTLLL